MRRQQICAGSAGAWNEVRAATGAQYAPFATRVAAGAPGEGGETGPWRRRQMLFVLTSGSSGAPEGGRRRSFDAG